LANNSDDYEPEDDGVGTGRKETNFTVLTINEIMDEQMSQINRIAELFEVRHARSGDFFAEFRFMPFFHPFIINIRLEP
jgi:hypothetical protein